MHFSSATDDWATPQDFFDAVAQRFGPFDLDVCASDANAKALVYFTKTDDGLAQPWRGRCWMNPPYGRGIGVWIRKAWESAQAGATVVCLVPARTDTAWWHDYVTRGGGSNLSGAGSSSAATKTARHFPAHSSYFSPQALI